MATIIDINAGEEPEVKFVVKGETMLVPYSAVCIAADSIRSKYTHLDIETINDDPES